MRIVDRYVLRELLVPFFLGLAVFTCVLLILRILKLTEMVVNRGVPLLQSLKLFSYILPAFLEVTVPMALILAILVAFGRLSSDSEIIALQASGIGLYRLMLPVGAFALGIAVLTLGLSLYVRPWGNHLLRTGLYELVKSRVSAGIRPKVFNDDFAGLVLYVDRITPPGDSLHGILISDTRDPNAHNTVYARLGIVIPSEETQTLTLRLLEGGIYSASPRGTGYQATRFSAYDINLDLGVALAKLRPREKEPTEMTLDELRETITKKKAADQATFTERVEFHRKFSIPFACLVFAALGVPLGIRPTRSVHSRGFSVSLVLIFVYYLFLTLGQSLGERGTLAPALALWLPNLCLSAVAAWLLVRAARDTGVVQPPLLHRWRLKLRTPAASRLR